MLRVIARTLVGAITMVVIFTVIILVSMGIWQIIKGYSLDDLFKAVFFGGFLIFAVCMITYCCHEMGRDIIG